MGKTLYDYCMERDDHTFLRQWDKEKNGNLTPHDVSTGSGKKTWWRCEKGHSWQAVVKNRVIGRGCPVCAGQQVQAGYNDIATTHPQLVNQWHPELNGELTPQMVTFGMHIKVWWLCSEGHVWQAPVSSRASGAAGCPVCRGLLVIPGVNDLESAFPEIAAQWHPTKNGDLTPQKVAPYSTKRAWWVCELGHEFRTDISNRTSGGHNCPYCSHRLLLAGFNDLETLIPQLADQWHPELNGELTPQMVMAGSSKKVWWICDEGHVWQAKVYSRTGKRKSGCPVCAGRVNKRKKKRYDEIIKEHSFAKHLTSSKTR